jgi:hypothetical protein
VSGSEEKAAEKQTWRILSEAGLVEIGPEEFVERIREVKKAVSVRLRELMEFDSGVQERDSAAHSLGTLKKLESKLQTSAAHGRDGEK